ncbi:YSC84-related protein [Campylobacter sp. 19-13652]|uniref:YSC84-related protein n=1 Tax=Campylobacter sp. 19-13652 TaxID=2840180 RepID=UPI001C74D83A|nr:YSC84-related protein [Campylobacter sp. 19-13652]BCX79631.1 hypothetical protein LBC_10930 [Campylobacter sp. 19-13652]
MLYRWLNKFIIFLASLAFLVSFAKASDSEELLLDAARSYTAVLRTNNVRPDIIKKAKAIVIFPSVKKVGLVFGGLGGSGVMVALNGDLVDSVSLVSIGGGGAGLQAGYSDSAVVLFLMKQSFIEDIKGLKLVLKADMIATFASASATKNGVYGDIYALSKDSGFYAGASLDAAVISYGGDVRQSDDYAYTELMNAINFENLK